MAMMLAAPANAQTPPAPAASSNDIPVIIRWEILKPDAISLKYPGGSLPLHYDESSKTFNGRIPRPDTLVQTRVLVIGYGPDRTQLYLSVSRYLSDIQFMVSRDNYLSCGNVYLEQAEARPNSADDAMRLMLSIAHMLSLKPDNDCRRARRSRAWKAMLASNYALSQQTDGLFAIDPNIKEQLKRALIDTGQPLVAANLAGYYETQAQGTALGVIYNDTKALAASGETKMALDRVEDMAMALKADSATAKAFETQGVTLNRLNGDAASLGAKMSDVGAIVIAP